MDQKQAIAQIYKILLLYEDVEKSNLAVNDYLSYLDRCYIYWVGVGNSNIYNIIKGLQTLGMEVEHQSVKSMVFHIIDVIQKEVVI